MIKTLLVDDSQLITSGLQIILNNDADITVVGTFAEAPAAIQYCQNQPVDVVLMDVRLPGMDGVTATKTLVQALGLKVIILTTFDEDDYIVQGIQNGAAGYLLKTTPPDQIIAAIKAVDQQQSVLSAPAMTKAAQQLTRQPVTANLSALTAREQELTQLVAQGLTNKQISQTLFLSEGTVNNSLSTILHKLDLSHRTQLAIYYLTGQVTRDDR